MHYCATDMYRLGFFKVNFLYTCRQKSVELLTGKPNGTFLCRPTNRQSKQRSGETHTHTVDVV